MESVANFTSRAKEIGMAEGLIDAMKDNGVNTFSKLAYICPSNPTSGDDSKLKEALEALIERALTPVEMISIRQLWFESYTFAMTELEERVNAKVFAHGRALSQDREAEDQIDWIDF